MHRVYAKCFGHRLYLQAIYEGTRYECEKFVKLRARLGQPTHFLFISKLDHERASRRYLED